MTGIENRRDQLRGSAGVLACGAIVRATRPSRADEGACHGRDCEEFPAADTVAITEPSGDVCGSPSECPGLWGSVVTIGEKIRAARLAERLTQEQLAGNDLSKSYISEVERGRRTPRRVTLKILAQRLQRPLSYFLDGAAEEREGELYLELGVAQLHNGSPDEAAGSLNTALELALQGGSEALPAKVELALAAADEQAGRSQQAQRRLERCLRVFVRLGDADSAAATQYRLGRLKLESGDPGSASWAFQAGLQHSDGSPNPMLRARLYLGLGTAQRRLGQAGAARDAFGRALEAARPFQDHRRLASWHLERAGAELRDGRFDRACQHVRRAQAVSEAFLYKGMLAEVHGGLGGLDAAEGNWEAAAFHHRWSVVLHGAASSVSGVAQALSGLAEVLLQRAAPEAARAACEAALSLLGGDADHKARARVLLVLGALYRIAGQGEQAKTALLESLDLSGRLGHASDVRLARQELAVLALERGDVEDARAHLQLLQKT